MSLGANIKTLRQGKGWTQGDLSKASGIKVGHISKLERDDNTDPKLSTLYSLMAALECSANTLIQDADKVGITGKLEAAFEMAQQLPDDEQETIIDIIRKYHKTAGLEQLMENKWVLGIKKIGRKN